MPTESLFTKEGDTLLIYKVTIRFVFKMYEVLCWLGGRRAAFLPGRGGLGVREGEQQGHLSQALKNRSGDFRPELKESWEKALMSEGTTLTQVWKDLQ